MDKSCRMSYMALIRSKPWWLDFGGIVVDRALIQGAETVTGYFNRSCGYVVVVA